MRILIWGAFYIVIYDKYVVYRKELEQLVMVNMSN